MNLSSPPSVSKLPRCLVLGGQGFIGSHLVDALQKTGHAVKIFDRPGTPSLNLHPHSQVELIEGDITSDADIAGAVVDCDICFHLISTVIPASSNLDPMFDIRTNLLGTIQLLNQAVRVGVKKIIFLSSGGTVYGVPVQLPIDENHPTDPTCSYGITKLAIEKYLSLYYQLYGLDYMVLRLSNTFGERQRIHAAQGAVAVFLGKALRDEPVEIWGDGSVMRDYIHVSDVISAMLKSMTYCGPEKLLNIGSGYGMSLNVVLDGIDCVIGKNIQRHYVSGRPLDVPVNVLAINRAEKVLGWTPKITFMEGLKRMKDFSQRLMSETL